MSVQTKALIEKWQDYKDIALSKACIQYHEEMIEGWKENLDYAKNSIREDTIRDEEGNHIDAEDAYIELVIESKGDWHGVDYHNYVTKDVFREAMMRDLDTMCRSWVFADDMIKEGN